MKRWRRGDEGSRYQSHSARLVRDLRVTRRTAEFTSTDALTAATGHESDEWALAVVKEASDNGTAR